MLKTRCLITLMAALAGCANYTQPVVSQEPKTPAERNFETLWQASISVLREYYFKIDREDRRDGVIRTDAMLGKQFGEFWRKDAASDTNLAESTLQTIFRQATVTIKPVGEDRFEPSVEVQTFRSNKEERQVSSTSEALNLFDLPEKGSPDEDLLKVKGASEEAVPLGRDAALEEKIRADILLKAGRF
jgi:hypothetical protein